MRASMLHSIFINRNRIYLFLFFAFLVLFFSCASKLKGSNHLPKSELEQRQIINTTTKTVSSDKIIFLNYSISKKENGTKKIEFISKILTDGKIKKNSNKFISKGNVGDLQCVQVNHLNKPLKSVILKNPLSKIIEYVNEANVLEKRKIETQESPFAIRLQLEPETKFIIINEITAPNKKINALITTKIY